MTDVLTLVRQFVNDEGWLDTLHAMNAHDCIQAHNTLYEIDQLIKSRWLSLGSPDVGEIR